MRVGGGKVLTRNTLCKFRLGRMKIWHDDFMGKDA